MLFLIRRLATYHRYPFYCLSPDRDSLGTGTVTRSSRFVLLVKLIGGGLTLKEAALFDWTASGSGTREALVLGISELAIVAVGG
jgi:hypothetical protein